MTAVLSLAQPALAAPVSLQQALAGSDVERLEQLGHGRGLQASLAQAVALSLRRQDDRAQPALENAARSKASAAERAAALQELSALHSRHGRYAAAAKSLDASAKLKPLDQEGEQTRGFFQALANVAPMRVEASPQARLPVKRDAAGLVRVDGTAEGQAQDFVVDTGAAFSTATASAVKRMGLRMLDTEATVSSASRDSVPTRFAVARDLVLGGVVLHDVVFIVVPDEALTFGDGAYRIDAILGLPVFLDVGRLAVETQDGHEWLMLGAAAPKTTEAPNLMLSGVQPMLLARSEAAGRTLRLFIDTGAASTLMYRNAADEAPRLARGAVAKAITVGGAGGSSTDGDARTLPRLDIRVGAAVVELSDVSLLSKALPDRHGAVGQDLLRQGRGYVMDFDRMCLSLLR